jgi:hypothetical protein
MRFPDREEGGLRVDEEGAPGSESVADLTVRRLLLHALARRGPIESKEADAISI